MVATSVTETLLRLEREYQRAELERDTSTLEQLFADDLYYTTFRGAVAGKAAAVSSAADPRRNLTRFELTDLNVLPMGDVAVVTGRADMQMDMAGADYSGGYRFTHVYRQHEGSWQIAVAQGTRISAA